jgi:ketosteroid isomerase-like protein
MKRLCVVAAILLLLSSVNVFSQEWSAAQKEVWKNVEAYNALADAGNVEGFMAYVHNDYLGWNYQSALPMDKAAVRKFVEYDFKTSKTVLSNIKPAGIGIFGNVAYVHYCWMSVYKDAEGKEKWVSGRYTDILMKQGDKWVIIGDHGGRTSKE